MPDISVSLGCRPFIVPEQSIQPLAADNFLAGLPGGRLLNQLIPNPLVIPLRVVMRLELKQGLPDLTFSEPDHPAQAVLLDRSDKSLGVGIGVRCLKRGLHHPQSSRQHRLEALDELGVAVTDRKAFSLQEAVRSSDCLDHEAVVGIPRHAGDVDPPGFEIEEEQHVQAAEASTSPGLHREEVRGHHLAPMCLQEASPGRRQLRSGQDSMLLEDVAHGRFRHPVLQILELTLDAAIAPPGVFACHAENEPSDQFHDAGAPDLFLGEGPLGGDQVAVPAEDGVRSHDRGDALRDLVAKPNALGREAPLLLVGQAEASIPDLLPQDPVLLD